MRDRRLVCLAVLAVAFGFAAAAHAGDTAVITVIVDPTGADPCSWQANARLWGAGGIGEAPESLGYLDFVFYSILGAGGWEVTASQNVSPYSYMTPDGGGDPLPVGFSPPIRSDGVQGVGIMAMQPSDYAADGENDPNMDQAVLVGIGVQDLNPGTWLPPTGYTRTGPDPNWTADTVVAKGSYDPHGVLGSLSLETFGKESFSVLPDPDKNGMYEGPTNDIGEASWVGTVVSQVMTGGTGNGGGAAGYGRETVLTVQVGTYVMSQNAGALAGPMVHAVVGSAPDTFIQLGADQDLLSVTIPYAADGVQGLDLNSPAGSGQYHALRIYAGDDANRAVVEGQIVAAIANAAASPSGMDGLFDSGAVNHPNLNDGPAIGVTDQWDVGGGQKVVLVRLTRMGDNDCDGTVTLGDLLTLRRNLFKPGNWDDGDYDGDGTVTLGDLLTLRRNLFQSYSPEPTSVCLLALAGLALLRRRR